jgi:pimeloyl-ACP methyl ester carboxylesterase
MASKRGLGARGSASLAKIETMRRTATRALQIVAALVVVVLGAGAIVAVVDEHSWPAAQLRTVAVLATTERTPVLRWAVAVVTPEPRVEETVVGGAPSTVVRPGSGQRWPAIVFVNGATRDGRHHPQVQRLARGLARAGFLAVVPDLPGLRAGEITPATMAATIQAAEATAERSDARGGQVGLYGVSVGASLALLAANHPRLASRVTVVGGEAPWVDLRRIVRLTTTGHYGNGPYATDPYASLAIGRSLAAGLPAGPERSRLVRRLRTIPDDAAQPLARLDPGSYEGSARALVELLVNRDPARFDKLYARLHRRVRAFVRVLSPLRVTSRLSAPVELASSPHDKYFPPAESRSLAKAVPNVRVTVTSTLDHAVPEPSIGDLADLIRFDGFVVRFLRAARG